MFGETLEINENTKYILKFNMNIFCKMDADGIDVMALDDENLSFTTLRTMLFYALQKYHGDVITTHDKAGDVIEAYIDNGGDFDAFSHLISTAIVKGIGVKNAVTELEKAAKKKKKA